MSGSNKNKKFWLAVMLSLLFGTIGLFYVSWPAGVVLFFAYFGFLAILSWPVLFIQLIFWWGLPVSTALFYCYSKKNKGNNLDKFASQDINLPAKPLESNDSVESATRFEISQVSLSSPQSQKLRVPIVEAQPEEPPVVTPESQPEKSDDKAAYENWWKAARRLAFFCLHTFTPKETK